MFRSPLLSCAAPGVILTLASHLAVAQTATESLAKLAAERSYPARVALAPVAVQWKFSGDEGKTYGLDALPPVPVRGQVPVAAQGVFQVEDPAALGAMWVTVDSPIGGMATTDAEAIGRRYVACVPILLKASVIVNGKPLVLPESGDAMLLERFPVDPQLLVKGRNTIDVGGLYWNTWVNMEQAHNVDVGFKMMSTPPDALELRTGPVLGPLGDDYFTLVCRTHIPAQVRVTVKPLDPDGPEKASDYERGTLHRLRIQLPKGTKKFRYSVTALNGSHGKTAGPFDVRVPQPDAMKFVVLGQTAAHPGQIEGLAVAALALQKADPDFIIHTGSIVKMAYWDFEWDESFLRPWKELLARVPICVVPAYKDSYSMAFARLFYHATPDGQWGPWSWTAGNARFIGMDSLWAAQNAEAVAAWTDENLKAAREDYVFSVSSYPGYISRPFGRGIDGHNFDRNVIHPLLARYGATAALGCTGAYEFQPAPASNGVQSVITGGVGAEMSPGQTDHHFCVFAIRDGKCSMEAYAYESGKVLDSRSFAPRKK